MSNSEYNSKCHSAFQRLSERKRNADSELEPLRYTVSYGVNGQFFDRRIPKGSLDECGFEIPPLINKEEDGWTCYFDAVSLDDDMGFAHYGPGESSNYPLPPSRNNLWKSFEISLNDCPTYRTYMKNYIDHLVSSAVNSLTPEESISQIMCDEEMSIPLFEGMSKGSFDMYNIQAEFGYENNQDYHHEIHFATWLHYVMVGALLKHNTEKAQQVATAAFKLFGDREPYAYFLDYSTVLLPFAVSTRNEDVIRWTVDWIKEVPRQNRIDTVMALQKSGYSWDCAGIDSCMISPIEHEKHIIDSWNILIYTTIVLTAILQSDNSDIFRQHGYLEHLALICGSNNPFIDYMHTRFIHVALASGVSKKDDNVGRHFSDDERIRYPKDKVRDPKEYRTRFVRDLMRFFNIPNTLVFDEIQNNMEWSLIEHAIYAGYDDIASEWLDIFITEFCHIPIHIDTLSAWVRYTTEMGMIETLTRLCQEIDSRNESTNHHHHHRVFTFEKLFASILVKKCMKQSRNEDTNFTVLKCRCCPCLGLLYSKVDREEVKRYLHFDTVGPLAAEAQRDAVSTSRGVCLGDTVTPSNNQDPEGHHMSKAQELDIAKIVLSTLDKDGGYSNTNNNNGEDTSSCASFEDMPDLITFDEELTNSKNSNKQEGWDIASFSDDCIV